MFFYFFLNQLQLLLLHMRIAYVQAWISLTLTNMERTDVRIQELETHLDYREEDVRDAIIKLDTLKYKLASLKCK